LINERFEPAINAEASPLNKEKDMSNITDVIPLHDTSIADNNAYQIMGYTNFFGMSWAVSSAPCKNQEMIDADILGDLEAHYEENSKTKQKTQQESAQCPLLMVSYPHSHMLGYGFGGPLGC